MSEVELIRVFKAGSITLNDPDPAMEPDAVRELYAVSYPHLATATVEGPTVTGDEAVYEFVPAPVKTKG